MAGGDAVQHLLAIDLAAAPAEQGSCNVGHENRVRCQVPLPDPAPRRLYGHAEAGFGIAAGSLYRVDFQGFPDQQGSQRKRGEQRDQEPCCQLCGTGRAICQAQVGTRREQPEQGQGTNDRGTRKPTKRRRARARPPFGLDAGHTVPSAVGHRCCSPDDSPT